MIESDELNAWAHIKGIHSRLPTLAKSSASTGSSEQISQGKGGMKLMLNGAVSWCGRSKKKTKSEAVGKDNVIFGFENRKVDALYAKG